MSRPAGETTKRLELDDYAKFKYDSTQQEDNRIVEHVEKIAQKRGVSMTEVSLAWLLSKVDAPVMGVTKAVHINGAVKAADLVLARDEMKYLEERYVPHALAGVMAQNGKQTIGGIV